MTQESANLNKAASVAGVYTPEALAIKLEALSIGDKALVDELLNSDGQPTLSDMVSNEDHLASLDEEKIKQVSSLIGDMRMYAYDKERKEIVKKIVELLCQ